MATKDQIWAAADAISAEGGNPTLAAVRAHLGGGSYTDISAAMQAWRSHQQASAAPIREPVPAALDERLNAFGGEVWAVALELANSRLQSERAALEQVQQEAEETRKEAAALADSLAAELDKAQAEIAALSQQLAGCAAKQEQQQALIGQANATATAATHRAELAEAARGELQIRAEQLGGLLKEEQAARAQLQGLLDKLTERLNVDAEKPKGAKK